VLLSQLCFDLRDRLSDVELPQEDRAAVEERLHWAERNLGERYHTGVENNCQDILGALRNQDAAFYEDEKRNVDFLYFIALQYFRTARMRKGLISVPSPFPGHDPLRTADILNHIHATNLGAGMCAERKQYEIVFLRNETAIPFITGDQPIVNLNDPRKTIDLALYYPLGPQLAMILAKASASSSDRVRSAGLLEVERYNYAIYSTAFDQVYSNDEAYLKSIPKLQKDLLPR
jgi:hypothetical protein